MWTPRYQVRHTSRPVTSVLNKYECGLLIFGFTFRKAPKFTMRASTVTLLRELLVQAQTTPDRHNANQAETTNQAETSAAAAIRARAFALDGDQDTDSDDDIPLNQRF